MIPRILMCLRSRSVLPPVRGTTQLAIYANEALDNLIFFINQEGQHMCVCTLGKSWCTIGNTGREESAVTRTTDVILERATSQFIVP